MNKPTGTRPPPDLSVFSRVPACLTGRPQWVVWKSEAREAGGKPTKIPYDPRAGRRASSADPRTWGTYAEALEAFSATPGLYAGIGYVFHESDPFAGIDLDDSLDDVGRLLPWAREAFDPAATYGEVSPSGRGVKFIARAKLPGDGTGINVKGFGEGGAGGVELYDRKRFFVITGDRYDDCPAEVRDCPAVAELYARLRPKPRPAPTGATRVDPHPGDGNRVKRCVTYLEKCPPAVSGQGGHNATLRAACECFRFGLSDPEAWDVLAWFNQAKTAGELWTEKELRHKLDDARAKVGSEFGRKLREERPADGNGRHQGNGNGSHAQSSDAPPADGNGRHDPGPQDAEFPLTDTGNGERLMHRHGGGLRFVAKWNRAIVFTGTHWQLDETGAADRLAVGTVRAMKREAAGILDPDKAKALFAHALRCEANRKIKDMLERASKVEGATVRPDALDADPWLLNVANGTLDLRTGRLRTHRREDLITKVCSIGYDPAATCPAFLGFLDRIFLRKASLIDFIQRAIGYSLTGVTSERALFILYGTGANGKSTLLGVVRDLLGGYASQTAAETLMMKKHEGIPNDVARLAGARFVSAVETDEGKRLSEALVKRMTGGEDMLSARFMRGEWFDFRPEFKLFLATNHKPEIRGTDNAIWDRIRLVPFDVTIPPEERDAALPDRLRAELPGVLAWAVEGCRRWVADGLGAPTEVVDATRDYREGMDKLGEFILEHCVTGGRDLRAGASQLYDLYKITCGLAGEEPINQTRFGRQLAERGFKSDREEGGQRRKI